MACDAKEIAVRFIADLPGNIIALINWLYLNVSGNLVAQVIIWLCSLGVIRRWLAQHHLTISEAVAAGREAAQLAEPVCDWIEHKIPDTLPGNVRLLHPSAGAPDQPVPPGPAMHAGGDNPSPPENETPPA
jgi:hypothetical protein